MIFGDVTAQLAAEFADMLPGDFVEKTAYLVRELLGRLPENSVTVTCTTSSGRGLFELRGQWHHLEKTHEILQTWVSFTQNISKQEQDAIPTAAGYTAQSAATVLLPAAEAEPEVKAFPLRLEVRVPIVDDNTNISDSDTVGQNACKETIVGESTKIRDVMTNFHKFPLTTAPLTEMPGAEMDEPVKTKRKRGRPRKKIMSTEESKKTEGRSVCAERRRSKRKIKPRSFSPTPVKKTIQRCNSNEMKVNNGKPKRVVTNTGSASEDSMRKIDAEKLRPRRAKNRIEYDENSLHNVSSIITMQCDECNYHTVSARNMVLHRERRHHMPYDFSCDKCDKKFRSNKDLIEHKHWHKNLFTCEHCHMEATSAFLLTRHMSRQHQEIMESESHANDHTQPDGSSTETRCTPSSDIQLLSDATEATGDVETENNADTPLTEADMWNSSTEEVTWENEASWFDDSPVKCALCKHQTTSRLNLRNHMQRMHMERKHECTICCKKFGLKKDLKEHQRWHNKTHKCTKCSKTFATVYLLNGHLAKIHGHVVKGEEKSTPIIRPRLPIYACEHCSYVTKFQRNFHNHLYRNHREKTLKCPECSKMFALQKDLKQHIMFHTVQVFTCSICGKKLRSKFGLKLHTDRIHKGIKKNPKAYLCTLCGKLCRNITVYKEHQNREHLHVKPFKCDTCGMAFHSKSILKIHKFKHTTERNFPCKLCDKAFKGRHSLNSHILTHKQLRPYECETCKKGFTQKAALIRHRRIHTGERPYKCKLCKSAFNDNSILRRHMIAVHKLHNGKLTGDVEYELDHEQLHIAMTSSEVLSGVNTRSQVALVKTESTDNLLAWTGHKKTKSTGKIHEPADGNNLQLPVCGQTTEVLIPSSLQFCTDNQIRTEPSATPFQSITIKNVKDDTTTASWELCAVTNPSHMGVTVGGVPDGATTSVGLWEQEGVSESTPDKVVTMVEEKQRYVWDSQVVPSASNETVVYAPLTLESDGVYILVSGDAVMSTTGETAVTMQDTHTEQQ